MLVVYGKPNCLQCNIAKNILNANKIAFEYRDVSVNANDLLFVKNTGAKSVPVIFNGTEKIGGVDQLKQWLDSNTVLTTKI